MDIGDLILVKGTSMIDRGIDWVENGEYSHVAIYVGDNRVLEAQGFKLVGYNSLDAYKGHYDVGHIDAPDEIRAQVVETAQSMIGKHYGWKTIIFLIIKLVFHIKYQYNIDNGIICSDYAAYCWNKYRPLTKKIRMNTPQDLADSALVLIEKEAP